MSASLRRSVIAAAGLMLLVTGCQFAEEHPKATLGASVGAVGGAVVGGLAGGKRGALYGAAIGAIGGAAVGAYLDHQDKTAAQTNAEHNYQPTQGVRLEFTNVAADPATVAPGGEVSLVATYALMAPNPRQHFQVTEDRAVTFNGEMIAQKATTVDRTPGTWTSKVPMTLPAGAARGTYQLQVTTTTEGQSTSLASNFTVQ
jgi:hypothetical protein